MSSIQSALLGGILIGLASAIFLLFNGKILGVSGIVGGLFRSPKADRLWRFSFVLGLVAGGFALRMILADPFQNLVNPSFYRVVIAGLIVGYGTQLGKGCTSGHGVCGCSRLSPRSIVATLLFMLSGAITVYIMNHVLMLQTGIQP